MSKKGDHDEIKLDKITKEELDKISEMYLVSRGQNKQINDHLNNSIVRDREDFPQTGLKTMGEYTGYLSKARGTQDLHMVKLLLKDSRTIDSSTKAGKKILLEQQAAVQEFLSAPLYELLIYNRAPKEGLIVDKDDSDKLYIRSKFLDNSQTLSAYLGYSKDTKRYNSIEKLKQIDGFEKVIAASLILGDSDYHDNNLMVINKDGKNLVAQIDHGLTFSGSNKNFYELMSFITPTFKMWRYDQLIKEGFLKFDINEFADSLKQMRERLNNEQIDNIIDSKLYALKQYGWVPSLQEFPTTTNDPQKLDENFAKIRQYYQNTVKENLANLREIGETLEIITKFDDISDEFKNGLWVVELSADRDPIIYAIKHNITIAGENPLEYASKNQVRINGKTFDDSLNILLKGLIDEKKDEQKVPDKLVEFLQNSGDKYKNLVEVSGYEYVPLLTGQVQKKSASSGKSRFSVEKVEVGNTISRKSKFSVTKVGASSKEIGRY